MVEPVFDSPVRIFGGGCPFCLGVSTGELKLDKKQKPYFTCAGCGTRAFIKSEHAYRVFSWVMSEGVSYVRAMQGQVQPAAARAGVGEGV